MGDDNKSFDIGAIGTGVADTAIGAGLGLLLEKHNDKRQYEQQKKLQELQSQEQRGMMDYSYNKQLQMWKDTNYSAQMEEMRKAGLNPSLMYGMSGGGATTAGSGGGQVSGGTAPGGGGEIMGIMLQKAQLQLMAAQTEKTKAETKSTNVNTGITETYGAKKMEAEIDNTMSTAANTRAQTTWTEIKADIDRVRRSWEEKNQQLAYDNLEHNCDIAYEKLQQERVQTYLDQATKDKAQEIINNTALEGAVRIELGKSNIKVNDQQIAESSARITQRWRELGQADEKIAIETFKAEMEANYPGFNKVLGNQAQEFIENLWRSTKGERQPMYKRVKK